MLPGQGRGLGEGVRLGDDEADRRPDRRERGADGTLLPQREGSGREGRCHGAHEPFVVDCVEPEPDETGPAGANVELLELVREGEDVDGFVAFEVFDVFEGVGVEEAFGVAAELVAEPALTVSARASARWRPTPAVARAAAATAEAVQSRARSRARGVRFIDITFRCVRGH